MRSEPNGSGIGLEDAPDFTPAGRLLSIAKSTAIRSNQIFDGYLPSASPAMLSSRQRLADLSANRVRM